MSNGKMDLGFLHKLISDNSDVIVPTNKIGTDFSTARNRDSTFIFKIEPAVYYDFLTPVENARLSFTFAMNDFLCSGRNPLYAMIDFESPPVPRHKFIEYIGYYYEILRMNHMLLSAAHTGIYNNSGFGVIGSIAMVGTGTPIFSHERIRRDDSFYIVGKIGLELRFFMFRKKMISARTEIEELAINPLVNLFLQQRKAVHYVHDIAEGGPYRALEEVSLLVNRGFDLDSSGMRMLVPPDLHNIGKNIISASSSGAAIVAISGRQSQSFEQSMSDSGIPFLKLASAEEGVLLDGKTYKGRDRLVSILSN